MNIPESVEREVRRWKKVETASIPILSALIPKVIHSEKPGAVRVFTTYPQNSQSYYYY